MKFLRLFEEFDYKKPYHEELQSEMVRLINTAYDLEVGDRVYNNDKYSEHKGKFGKVISFYEKDWRKADKPSLIGKPYIKWEGEDKVEDYPSTIKYSGDSTIGYNIMKADIIDEFEKVKEEYFKLINITNTLNISKAIKDLKNEISDEEFKSKYNLNDKEYEYLLDSPEVRFAFR